MSLMPARAWSLELCLGLCNRPLDPVEEIRSILYRTAQRFQRVEDHRQLLAAHIDDDTVGIMFPGGSGCHGSSRSLSSDWRYGFGATNYRHVE